MQVSLLIMRSVLLTGIIHLSEGEHFLAYTVTKHIPITHISLVK